MVRFHFTVADDARDAELRTVECDPAMMREGASKLSPSWTEPEVFGATWLGMPSEKEN
jgi:hypothetical protein